MANKQTIREIISRIRESEEKARNEAVALIRQIHQNPPMQSWTSEAEYRKVFGYPKILGEPLGLHVPAKSEASFKGWYRPGQKRGMPSKRLLYAKEDLAFKQYTDQMAAIFPVSEQSAILGKRSGQSRAQSGLKQSIVDLYIELEKQGIAKHRRRKMIAKQLRCSVDWVNEVIQSHLKN